MTKRVNKAKLAIGIETYSMLTISSLWNIDNRRTLLSASHTRTQSLESNPAKSV